METVIPERRLSEEPSVRKGFLGHMCFSGLYSRSALPPDLRQIKMAASDTTALQMDVQTRNTFVMAAVTPEERATAASFTLIPRNLASSLSPRLGGALFAAGFLTGLRYFEKLPTT